MTKSAQYTIWAIVIIIVLVLIGYWIWSSYATSGVSSYNQSSTTANSVSLNSSSALGAYMTDSAGRTLYYFANDVVGKSNCSGACSSVWPPFYAANISVPTGLNSVDFGEIQNSDGKNQTTYLGWPLYYYSGDAAAGDINGDNYQKIWFVAKNPFYDVLVMNNASQNMYLANQSGMSLYYDKSDIPGTATADPQSKCTGDCLSNFTVFDKGSPVSVPSLLNSSDFTEFTRPDGTTQLAYKGYPLYMYSGDNASGDTNGNGLDSDWYLEKP